MSQCVSEFPEVQLLKLHQQSDFFSVSASILRLNEDQGHDFHYNLGKVFENRPSKICGREPFI